MLTVIVSISEIEAQISHYRRLLLTSPRSYPWRSLHLKELAALYDNRYVHSRQKEDLDMSILYSTEAIFVAPHSDRADQDTVQGFYLLGTGLMNRLQLSKQPSDAQHCTEVFRYLESLPLETYGVSSDEANLYLLFTLDFHVKLGIGNAAQNIGEMMDRCRNLLVPNIPRPLLRRAISALVRAHNVYSNYSPASEYLDTLIDRLREANRRLDSHEPLVTLELAAHLSRRFRGINSMDDYEEAMALFDKVIASQPNSDCLGPYMASALFFSAILAAERSRIYKNPGYLEEAIHRHREFLRIPSTNDSNHSTIIRGLKILTRERSSHFNITGKGLPPARFPDPQVTSFRNLVASLRARSAIGKTDWRSAPEERSKHLRALETVCRTTDIAEVADAIEYCQLLLASTPPSDMITYYPANALGEVLFHAFECTGNLEYLNKSITAFRNILGMPGARWARFNVIAGLHDALSARCNILGDEKAFEETMQLYSTASNDTYANVPDRLGFSYLWAENARRHGHHSTPTAYETSLSLMEDLLLFAPTLETQHLHLMSRRYVYEEFPGNIASYEISRGRLPHAIEALERGRALIWSQLRGFRTPMDQLAFAPHLAEEFTAVSRELETLTTSVSPDIIMNDSGEHEDGERMDKFGRFVVQHHELSARRKDLVSKIQTMPGLEGFLKTPSFGTLRSAAACGPVIIVNHSEWRCDILIVLHDADPSLITTSDDFYGRAIELRNQLVRTRSNKLIPLESRQYQRTLQFVLKSLYELVGRSVIEELRRLKIPEQSRVWWCPTSVFCSLPLHAMGPIVSDDGIMRYFSDLYIPSYTPTLLALIESQNPGKSSLDSEKPSVLLVANPDEVMEKAIPEIQHVQRLGTKVTTLMRKRATPSAVVESLQNHRFAHFICHGILEKEKPFNASFKLSNGVHLTLLEIVRSRLPDAEFAFLSACHTAELTEGSIADEGLHLAAAVQYCGFRSVVGTMWAMADQDGGDLAKQFYDSMFSSDESGVSYHERSARALRDAVRTIRKEKRLPLEQWVNFVHYGA